MGNDDNGVEVGGNAHDIVIGGPQPTFNIIPHNAISANGGNGVAIVGTAHNITVSYSYIGTDLTGMQRARQRQGAACFSAPARTRITIGSADPSLLTVISGNLGDGIEMRGTHGNTVVGSLIGTDATGALPLPNGGNGILISNSFNNVIGRSGTASPTACAARTRQPHRLQRRQRRVRRLGQRQRHPRELDLRQRLARHRSGGRRQHEPSGPGADLGAIRSRLGIQVSGTLTSKPNTTFTIEFFANDTSGPSGPSSSGSVTVTTNAAGVATFTFIGAASAGGRQLHHGDGDRSQRQHVGVLVARVAGH